MATSLRRAGPSDRRCPAGRGVLGELRPSRPGPGDAPKHADAERPRRGVPARSVGKRSLLLRVAASLVLAACLPGTASAAAHGTAWAWGWKEYGQLGDNTTTGWLLVLDVKGNIISRSRSDSYEGPPCGLNDIHDVLGAKQAER